MLDKPHHPDTSKEEWVVEPDHMAAAIAGDVHMQLVVACTYMRADDFAEARPWLERAAQQGDTVALYNLGRMYYKGHGVSQDWPKAAECYRTAADGGHQSAQYNLGLLYEYGEGVKQDAEEAIKWCQLAAAQGHTGAQYFLARKYDAGDSLPQDRDKAHGLFLQSAEQGHPRSQLQLGCWYAGSGNVDVDMRESAKWFMEAALNGDGGGLYVIGDLYAQGLFGFQDNLIHAYAFMMKAADRRYPRANQRLGSLERSLRETGQMGRARQVYNELEIEDWNPEAPICTRQ